MKKILLVFSVISILASCSNVVFDVNLYGDTGGGTKDLVVNVGDKVLAKSTQTTLNDSECRYVGGTVQCSDSSQYSATSSSKWTSSDESIARQVGDIYLAATFETYAVGKVKICAQYENMMDCANLTVK